MHTCTWLACMLLTSKPHNPLLLFSPAPTMTRRASQDLDRHNWRQDHQGMAWHSAHPPKYTHHMHACRWAAEVRHNWHMLLKEFKAFKALHLSTPHMQLHTSATKPSPCLPKSSGTPAGHTWSGATAMRRATWHQHIPAHPGPIPTHTRDKSTIQVQINTWTSRHGRTNTSKPPAVLHLAAAASRQLLLPARGWGRAARCGRCTARVFKRFNAAGMQPRPAATIYNAWMYVPVDRSSAVPLQVLAQLQDAALAIGRLKILSSPFRRAYDHLLHALRRQPTAQRLAGQSPPNGDR
jgi:hypothetical protein